MSVNSVSAGAVKPEVAPNVKISRESTEKSRASGKEDQTKTELREDKVDRKELADGVLKLNETARIFNKAIHFKMHEKSKRWMVQIINAENGKVINEIPPEKILDMVASLDQLVGLLVDEKR
ncbi:MAG: flagellar protein FlaG [Eubacteriales bacterium]